MDASWSLRSKVGESSLRISCLTYCWVIVEPPCSIVAGLRVGAGRPEDRPRVDAVVAVEALVLDGDDGVAHVRRDLLERDDLAVLLGVERVHERAVGGVEGGRLDLLPRPAGTMARDVYVHAPTAPASASEACRGCG